MQQTANQSVPAMSFKVRNPVNHQSKLQSCACSLVSVRKRSLSLWCGWYVNNESISVVRSTFCCLPPGDFRMLAKVFPILQEYKAGWEKKLKVFLKTEL